VLTLEKEKLCKQRDQYEEELAKYENRLGKGEFNPATTKVLHLAINPETIAKAQKAGNDLVT